MRPRVLFVGRTRYRMPLNDTLRRKWKALADALDIRVLATLAADSPERRDEELRFFELVAPARPRRLDGALFYALLPVRVARLLRRFRPQVVIAESPFEAAAVVLARRLAGSDVRILLEIHGDWRTAMRLYGSPARKVLGPLADVVAAWSVRRADGVRPVSTYLADLVRGLGVEPVAVFPAFIDVEPFVDRPPTPLPDEPRAIFIGVLELYKNIDGLAAAWRRAAPRVPQATLRLVGTGSRTDIVEELLRDLPEQTQWTPVLATPEVARALDEACVLVLPSRSEGLGRVIVESLCRGRPVLAGRTGGTPDVIKDGVNGILLDPEDRETLAETLVRVLSDRELLERMAGAARASAEPFVASPEEYARRIRDVVARVAA
ncbi:MAG TPA: glycosyltransferase family 4 protein [Gaiellaceae bacterium]|nr:glycosyltransferase family 4 protein [Gaiellaceae bacterium]